MGFKKRYYTTEENSRLLCLDITSGVLYFYGDDGIAKLLKGNDAVTLVASLSAERLLPKIAAASIIDTIREKVA